MSDSGDFSKERENPFQPIDPEQRLSQPPRSRASRHRLTIQPGQLYSGGLSVAPIKEAPADTGSFSPAPAAIPSYLKRQPLFSAPEPPPPPPYAPPTRQPDIPSYLKKQPPLPPFAPYGTPPLEHSGPDGSFGMPQDGVRIASTFPAPGGERCAPPPVRDEIAAFFNEEESAPLAQEELEEEYYPSPAFSPERAMSPDDSPAQHAGYEDAILPESAELPEQPEGNPGYQPPAYELFSTSPGAGELSSGSGSLWETAPPVPAYTPPSFDPIAQPAASMPAAGQTSPRQPTGSLPPAASGAERPLSRPAPSGIPVKPLVKKRKQPAPEHTTQPPKPPIRWGRIVAALACAAMLIFCCVVGGRLLYRIEKNAKEMDELMNAYEQSGGSLIQSATRVDLPPAGQTLPPGATQAPAQNASAGQTTPGSLQGNNKGAVQNALDQTEDEQTEDGQPTEAPAGETRTRLTRYPDNSLRNILDSMAQVHKDYPDVVGRLVIPGVLDEMVVMKDNTYYLSRNYRGGLSGGGAVYIDESCSLLTPPENLLLRGQGDVQGKSFAPLWQYRDGGEAFVTQAYTATLTTLYEEESYVLLSVILVSTDPGKSDYFDFSSHSSFATDSQMAEYVNSAMSRSLYRFSTNAQPSDRLLTLATVSGGESGQCIVLIFRMKRNNE